MKKLMALLAGLLLISSLAVAQADPDPDSMGIYFDTDATVNAYFTSAPFQQVSAYLVIANPTSVGVSGWECAVELVGSPVASSWAYAGGGLNVYDAVVTGLFNVGVGPGPLALLPVNNVVVLATFSCFVLSPLDEIHFIIYPFPGSVTFEATPGYVDGDDVGIIIPCDVSSGTPYGAPCATINSTYTVVDNAPMTWSGVKSLYQ